MMNLWRGFEMNDMYALLVFDRCSGLMVLFSRSTCSIVRFRLNISMGLSPVSASIMKASLAPILVIASATLLISSMVGVFS